MLAVLPFLMSDEGCNMYLQIQNTYDNAKYNAMFHQYKPDLMVDQLCLMFKNWKQQAKKKHWSVCDIFAKVI